MAKTATASLATKIDCQCKQAMRFVEISGTAGKINSWMMRCVNPACLYYSLDVRFRRLDGGVVVVHRISSDHGVEELLSGNFPMHLIDESAFFAQHGGPEVWQPHFTIQSQPTHSGGRRH